MKVLAVHNRYQQPGGEDQVFLAETALLEPYGHRVLRYEVHNDQVEQVNRLTLAKDTVWNTSAYRELRALIRRERPDVVQRRLAGRVGRSLRRSIPAPGPSSTREPEKCSKPTWKTDPPTPPRIGAASSKRWWGFGERVHPFEALEEDGFQPKRRSVGASERDEFLRAAWRTLVCGRLDGRRFVFVDECSTNTSLSPILEAMGSALGAVGSRDASGFFEHRGYHFLAQPL